MEEETFQVKCGICNKEFQMWASPERRDGATMDCPICDGLILGMPDGSTVDFHLHLHNSSGGIWPADGEGTGSFSIGEEE
jgi:hypothetical protein